MHTIPSIIHLLFLNKNENMPGIFLSCQERIEQFHPGWTIKIYNEDDARLILEKEFPSLLPVYYSYQHVVQKSDLLRVLLVYLYGGFYMDLDMYCMKAIDELRKYELVLGEEKIISLAEMQAMGLQHQQRIANYMFGSIPAHPFWLAFLKACIEKVNNPIIADNDILETTGPGLLTNVYHQYKNEIMGITVLPNRDRPCLISTHPAISCHFGNYAAHLHRGTWRWKIDDMPPTALQEINSRFKLPDTTIRLCATPPTTPYLAYLYDALPNNKNGAINIFFSGQEHMAKQGDNNILIYQNTDPVDAAIFDSCIVFSEKDQAYLEKSGIPATVVDPFFIRQQRFLGENEELSIDNTFHLISNGRDLPVLLSVCEQLINTTIPGLQLTLIGAQGEYPSWVHALSESAPWPPYIHCAICKGDFPILSMQSVYQGIPAIIYRNEFDMAAYCYVAADTGDLHADMCDAIAAVHQNYSTYNECAIEAARDIEDKWDVTTTVHQIIKSIA